MQSGCKPFQISYSRLRGCCGTHYIARMPKQSQQAWAIFRLAAKAMYLGQVTAPDETRAIKAAIKNLPVNNPEHRKRLIARKVEH